MKQPEKPFEEFTFSKSIFAFVFTVLGVIVSLVITWTITSWDNFITGFFYFVIIVLAVLIAWLIRLPKWIEGRNKWLRLIARILVVLVIYSSLLSAFFLGISRPDILVFGNFLYSPGDIKALIFRDNYPLPIKTNRLYYDFEKELPHVGMEFFFKNTQNLDGRNMDIIVDNQDAKIKGFDDGENVCRIKVMDANDAYAYTTIRHSDVNSDNGYIRKDIKQDFLKPQKNIPDLSWNKIVSVTIEAQKSDVSNPGQIKKGLCQISKIRFIK